MFARQLKHDGSLTVCRSTGTEQLHDGVAVLFPIYFMVLLAGIDFHTPGARNVIVVPDVSPALRSGRVR